MKPESSRAVVFLHGPKSLQSLLRTLGRLTHSLRVGLLILTVLGFSGQAMAQYLRWQDINMPDPPEPPIKIELDALEAWANEGNWTFKQQFAMAYLYEHLKTERWDFGCRLLQYGHLCRAMAERPESGERFLREIIDLEGNGPFTPENLARIKERRSRLPRSQYSGDGPMSNYTLAKFQAEYAGHRLFAARPDYSPQDTACQEAVHYFERAMMNEFMYWGHSCVARRMGSLAFDGQCMPKDKEKSSFLFSIARPCPMP